MDDWEEDFVFLENTPTMGSSTAEETAQDKPVGSHQEADKHTQQTKLASPAQHIDLGNVYQCAFPETRTGDSLAHRNAQSQAFCGWLSYLLKKADSSALPVHDLCAVFTSAYQLELIVSTLTSTTVVGLVEPQNAYDKITNLNLAMDVLAQHFPGFTEVSASSIASNNLKIALDLAWSIFYFSTLKPIKYCGLEDRFALLLWTQHTASAFPNTPIINDFANSFSDGLVICAIIESKVPGSLDTRSFSSIQKQANLRRGLDAAEKHFGIPKFLSPVDVIRDDPDEISMLIYLTLLYEHCKI